MYAMMSAMYAMMSAMYAIIGYVKSESKPLISSFIAQI